MTKILDLPETEIIKDEDYLVIVQDKKTFKIKVGNFKKSIKDSNNGKSMV